MGTEALSWPQGLAEQVAESSMPALQPGLETVGESLGSRSPDLAGVGSGVGTDCHAAPSPA